MKRLLLVLYFVLLPALCWGWTAHVTFDAASDPTYKTVVLVSETSGDYSEAYGQISEPGATTVDIASIKPATQYYFIAYRLTAENERSANSEEYPFLTEANIAPIVHSLPPIETGGVVLNISVTVQ